MKINNAIIFAAGKGTRMSPLTQHTPKPLIKVHGERMVERNIIFLNESGIKNITVVVGYLGEQFNFLKEKYGVNLVTNDMYSSSNNISSMVVTKELWGNTLYLEGDIYLKNNIVPQIVAEINKSDRSLMFGAVTPNDMDEWKFNIDANGDVIDHNPPALKGDRIWTGILFVNETTANQMRNNVDKWFAINRQKYFEQFLWSIEERFVMKDISIEDFLELDNFSDLIKIDPFYASQDSFTLFTPGPTNVPRNLWDAMSSGVVHHRSELAEYYISTLVHGLKDIFNTSKGLPLILTSSGTGAMEAAAVNIIKEGDKVVVIRNGDFGKRFSDILTANKINFEEIDFGFGVPVDLDIVGAKTKNADVVFVTHHETSNGILNPVKEIAKIIKTNDSLLVVDSISSIVSEELEFDEWGIDVALGSSPKAFTLTPGISFVCISEKAKEKILSNEVNHFYFDLKKYISYYEEYKQTPFTPNISLIIGMVSSIEEIKNKTMNVERKTKDDIFEYLDSSLAKLGFSNSIDPLNRTRAMLCLTAPKGVSARKLRGKVSSNHHIYFELGKGDLAETTIRIGILGPVSMDDAVKLVEAIRKELN